MVWRGRQLSKQEHDEVLSPETGEARDALGHVMGTSHVVWVSTIHEDFLEEMTLRLSRNLEDKEDYPRDWMTRWWNWEKNVPGNRDRMGKVLAMRENMKHLKN